MDSTEDFNRIADGTYAMSDIQDYWTALIIHKQLNGKVNENFN